MMDVLLLRLDAPLIAFGAPSVDQNGVVQPFPGRSLLTGLLANALGWDHRDFDKLQALQDRLQVAARIDRRGEPLLDYQTVDLGQSWMLPEEAGWTTRGKIAERGGASSTGTHIRYRHYRADSVHTVAVGLTGAPEPPSIDELRAALEAPARPLFLGRKSCLPAAPILLNTTSATSPLAALAEVPRLGRSRRPDDGPLLAWWDDASTDEVKAVVGPIETIVVSDERDWRNQVHVGRRFWAHGRIDAPATEARGD